MNPDVKEACTRSRLHALNDPETIPSPSVGDQLKRTVSRKKLKLACLPGHLLMDNGRQTHLVLLELLVHMFE